MSETRYSPVEAIYHWPLHDFSYLRICKCWSSTLVNHFSRNDPASNVVDEPRGSIRFAAIRHPVDRCLSHYSRIYHAEWLEDYVYGILPCLVRKGDPHVVPYAEITNIATHIGTVETATVWWGWMSAIKPAIFGEYPSIIANSSRPAHRPHSGAVAAIRDVIMGFYHDDLALWEEVNERVRRSPAGDAGTLRMVRTETI